MFNGTRLTDARSTEAHAITWDYRLDTDGSLWRILDPLRHSKHFRWDNDQQLVWASTPFTFDQGRVNPSNSTTRHAFARLAGQPVRLRAVSVPYQ